MTFRTKGRTLQLGTFFSLQRVSGYASEYTHDVCVTCRANYITMQLPSHTNLCPPQKAVFLSKARLYVSAQHKGGYAVMLLLTCAMEGIDCFDVLDHWINLSTFLLILLVQLRVGLNVEEH